MEINWEYEYKELVKEYCVALDILQRYLNNVHVPAWKIKKFLKTGEAELCICEVNPMYGKFHVGYDVHRNYICICDHCNFPINEHNNKKSR